MQITRTSLWSGTTRTLDLNITPDQYAALPCGMLIQRAMPQLSKSEREFVISGMIDSEWQEMAAGEEEQEQA
jgi:hypothetical protein